MKVRRLCAILVAAAMVVTGAVSVFAENPYANPYAQPAETEAANPYDNPYANPYAEPAETEAANPYDNPYANPYAEPAETEAANPYDNPYANPYAEPAETEAANPYDNPYANPYADPNAETEAPEGGAEVAEAEEYVPVDGEKYTVTPMDGWYCIVNDGGAVLGISGTSGVKLIEDDGFAFKDLNKNGALDAYEDWRLSTEERVADLTSQMSGAEMAATLSHGGWGNFTTEPLAEDDGSYTFLMKGGRGGVTRQIARGIGDHAKWANAIQAVAEGCFYGIPGMISIDPANISGVVESLALASTMDVELAAAIGVETSIQYRLAGVTALLGPQVDIASPVMNRAGGTYGEDTRLTLDIATAYVNAMQSTYDEEGNDLGWGPDSVYCFTKHFAGAGSTEGGRDDHSKGGRFAIFPGDNFEAHLITYFDGVFKLPGMTMTSGIMTEYAQNVDADGVSLGGEWAAAYNPYIFGMLDAGGFNGLIITDWGTQGGFGAGDATGTWTPAEFNDMTVAERMACQWKAGTMILGGNGDMESIAEAYELLVAELGEEEACALIASKAGKFYEVMFNLGMFDCPYSDAEAAAAYEPAVKGLDTQDASIVMIKNDGVLGEAKEMPTVYVPYVYGNGFSVSWMGGITEASETPIYTNVMNLETLANYFNVVTDTLGEDGVLTRASEEEVAACDYILVGMTAPYSLSYDKHTTAVWFAYEGDDPDEWYPYSLQYGEYTADTARDPSFTGLPLEDGTIENRSFKGMTAPADANYGHLETLQYVDSIAGDIPVIVAMNMSRGMVWGEVEPLADAILVSYNGMKSDSIAKIITGELEPNGLLVFQQPANMEAVEAQLEDVPRDMEVYVDAAGNAYDFAFGLNFSGVIDDERVATYSAEPLSKVEAFDYQAFKEANK